ncbi:phosphotransferase enzyme family protein [Neobacillus mesonae]|uniref:phosphotransferase enzyme family protein n=1 Tax=Neobacillus mesonae TaxID=1193713 RepID=UPI00203EF77D|nr:phosphotransferase [Neobacillus mesonae]MCM3567659.1 phosphotransferase [Neobacillus mesonae]
MNEKLSLDQLFVKLQLIAHQAAACYPFLTQSTIQLLNYSENATFLVTKKSSEQYILRISRPYYHTKQEIESELAWIQSIHQNTLIKVSMPIWGKSGEFVQEITYENIPYYCTLFTYLKGHPPGENGNHELVIQFEMLGELTAQLHMHSIHNRDKFQQFKRFQWNYDSILGMNPKWGRWQEGLDITPERLELFEQVSQKIKKRLEYYGNSPTKYGLIHSDLRSANLIVADRQIQVIDFDDCGFGWYLYDLAASLSFIEHKSIVPSLITSWLKGYRKIRTLSAEEELEIPTFILMRRLQLIAWIGSRDNETTRELGARFTQQTDSLAKSYLTNTFCLQ